MEQMFEVAKKQPEEHKPPAVDRWIGDIVGALHDPIIVMPGGWGDSLPEWIKTQVTLERLIENMEMTKGKEPTGTDAEATAYLFTASLTAPMGEQWTRIYLYVAGRTMAKKKVELPEDIKVESLSDYDEQALNKLKAWIYRQRTKARQEKGRAERRQKKEEPKQAETTAAQPPLFNLT
jgi:hypothetical protein